MHNQSGQLSNHLNKQYANCTFPTGSSDDTRLEVIHLSSSDTQDPVRDAKASDAADRALTIM